jgi:shikimate kinase
LKVHRPLFLVGMMGSGKTTLGKRLARECGLDFIDLDREIERRTGVTVGTIFEIEGEAGFRSRETQLLAELCGEGEMVIATGGGTVMQPLNRARMQATGWVVYLHATANLIYSRTRSDRARPLLQVADPMARINQLLNQRDPLYREIADLVIEAGRDAGTVVSEIKHQSECHADPDH